MRRLPQKLFAVASATGLALALGGLLPESEDGPCPQPPDGADGLAAPHPETVRLRLWAKNALAHDVVAGRRSLGEAAALFGVLNRLPPEMVWPAAIVDEDVPIPMRTEEGRLCWQVVRWVWGLKELGPGRAEAAADRLAAELHAELQARGVIRLPDPATLESAESLMERAREAAHWRGPGRGGAGGGPAAPYNPRTTKAPEGVLMSAPQAVDPWVVFDYETKTLFDLLPLLEAGNPEFAALPLTVQNAVVESALWHARQLADILLSRGGDADDINLAKLLPGFQPAQLGLLEAEYGKPANVGSPCWTLNKMLAHPTAHGDGGFDYPALLVKLRPLLAHIIREVRGQRRAAPPP